MANRLSERPRSLYERLIEALMRRKARRVCVYTNPVTLDRLELWTIGDDAELVVRNGFLSGSVTVYKPLRGDVVEAVAEYRKNGLK